MNKKVKKKWIKALRKGEVNGKPVVQTDNFLGKIDKVVVEDGKHKGKKARQLCCLGVLCELAVEEGIISRKEGYFESAQIHTYVYEGEFQHLPNEVVAWAGLDKSDPRVTHFDVDENANINTTLAELNDDFDYTFESIADVIEEQL